MKQLCTAVTLAAALSLGSAANAADPGLGLGLTWVFGQHGGGGLAAGVKVFTSREENKVAGSLGLDYQFNSASLRPNLGAAYIGDNFYGDASFGYNISEQVIDFGLGGGATNSKD